MPTLGYCIVCGGRIFEMNVSFGANYFCSECGIAYHRLTPKLKLTDYAKNLLER